MLYTQHCLSNLTIGTLLSAGITSTELAQHIAPLPFAGAFVVATFLLSPDLDLHHSSPTQNWGFLKKLWWPYSKIFRHRGISHVPILGTGTRFFYLCALSLLCVLAYDISIAASQNLNWTFIESASVGRMQELWESARSHEKLLLSIFAGLTASDLSHLLVDAVGSFLKRL